MTFDQVWTFLASGTPADRIVLVAVSWAIVTGRLVPRWAYDHVISERDEWKQIANNALHLFGRSQDHDRS